MKKLSCILPLAAFLLPAFAFASSTTDFVSELAGLFYVVAGLMLTAALLLMIGGGVMWYTRLGTYPTYRDDAIHIMEWAVAILFMLVVLLGIVEFIQHQTSIFLYFLGVAVILLVAWAIAASGVVGGGSGEKKEEEHGH